jgi:hypothetical protein
MRVQLEGVGAARPSEKLTLAGPDDFDSVFQVFANGRLLGGFGDFSGKTPVTYFSVPTLFPLPPPAGSPNGTAADGSGDKRQATPVGDLKLEAEIEIAEEDMDYMRLP